MSKGIDIKFVQERYQRMPDDQLIRIATQEAYGLTPEAINVVKAEIQKRGLDSNIASGVDAQNKTYTTEEVDLYCNIISILSCPLCGKKTERLNGTMIVEVMSFVIFTSYDKKIRVACPQCLDNLNNRAMRKSAIFGWWGLPWGFIRTPQAIRLNLDSKSTNHLNGPNEYLREFTISVIGEIETYKDNEDKLDEILKRRNRE